MKIQEIGNEIKSVGKILKMFEKTCVTDIHVDMRYGALKNILNY